MPRLPIFLLIVLIFLPIAVHAQDTRPAAMPDSHHDLERPVPYDAMTAFLEELAEGSDLFELSVPGKSVEGRDIHLLRVRHAEAPEDAWRVFLIGAQHGNEPAGKDGILYLLKEIRENPALLPPDVELWALPLSNPDGFVDNARRNANDVDLNRNHVELSEPETALLHELARRIRPHVSVDCHEFGRDSSDYTSQGWTEWPLIMMDTANHPFLSDHQYEAGLEWVHGAEPAMKAAGHNYRRYIVGDAPPAGEVRFSTLDVDDCRNGLATYGGLSFIIESGIFRGSDNPNADLHERVDAYLVLLRRFLTDEEMIARHRELLQQAAAEPMPAHIPVNEFWGSVGLKVVDVPVVDFDGSVKMVPTGNFMDERIVKKTVPVPAGYLIRASAAGTFRPVLEAGGIAFTEISEGNSAEGEEAVLVRMEPDYDPVYERYGGRQIVERGERRSIEIHPGDLVVMLDQQEFPRRAALVLAPLRMYGLYQYRDFEPLATEGEPLPVVRLHEAPPAM